MSPFYSWENGICKVEELVYAVCSEWRSREPDQGLRRNSVRFRWSTLASLAFSYAFERMSCAPVLSRAQRPALQYGGRGHSACPRAACRSSMELQPRSQHKTEQTCGPVSAAGDRRQTGWTELRTPAEKGFESKSPNPESALFQQNRLTQGPLQPSPAFPSQKA